MDSQKEIELLKKKVAREKSARQEAERILEIKAIELYEANKQLNKELETVSVSSKRAIEIRNRELKESEEKYRELLESLSDVVFTIDKKGVFTYVSEVSQKVIGYAPRELIGKHFKFLLREDYQSKIRKFYQLDSLKVRGNEMEVEFPVIHKSGNEIWTRQKIKMIYDESKRINGFSCISSDISDIKKAEIALKRSEEKYRGIIENLKFGILEVDNNGVVLKAYESFCKLTGYTSDELEGTNPIKRLLPEEFIPIMLSQRSSREDEKTGVYEVQMVCKSGEKKWVVISGAPTYDDFGNVTGSVGIHWDVTEKHHLEDELREAKLIAERSVEAKQLFLANMSHEIRTPMNAIVGMTNLIKQEDKKLQGNKYLNAIQTSADNLLIIINDILDFSKLESGTFNLDDKPFNLVDTIELTRKTLQYKAEEKSILFSTNIEIQEDSQNYIGDSTRLNQVLVNLVGNAIKFTSENGKVSLVVSEEEGEDENYSIIRIEVIDTGVGISKEGISKIFNSFEQESIGVSTEFGGTGLGLSISKDLVEMMGGELKVESEKGKGSNFYFTLKIPKTNEKLESEKDMGHTDLSETLSGKKVLLVEDNEFNRMLALAYLDKWGVKTDIAENGKIAIHKIERMNYDLVLMDMQMPVMNGIESTKYIRKNISTQLPIIALTANAIKGDDQACKDAGMNDYLSKPFRESDLFSKMVEYTSNNDLKIPIEEHEKEEGDFENTRDYHDLSKLNAVAGGNNEFINNMLKIFVNETPSAIDDMLKAVHAKEVKTVSSAAHRIKPSFNYISKPEVYQLVRDIEQNENIDIPTLEIKVKKLSKISEIIIESLKKEYSI